MNRLRGLVTESTGHSKDIDVDSLIELSAMAPIAAGGGLSGSAGGRVAAEDNRRRLHEVWFQWMYGKRNSTIATTG